MEFSRRTTQLMYEDHCAATTMIGALEDMIASVGRGIPDADDAQIRQILNNTAAAIEQEVRSHFAFEEVELFTRLEEDGEPEIVNLLLEEHQVILPIGEQVVASAKEALTNGFSAQNWAEFKSGAGEFIEKLRAHILKEDMALLPLLDDLLDPETDMCLAASHSHNQ